MLVWWSVVPAVCMVTGVALAHLRMAPPLVGFALTVLSGPLGLVVGSVLLAARWRGVDIAAWWPAAILSLAPLAVLIVAARPLLRCPRINDVSTDLARPLAFQGVAELPENRGRDLSFPKSTGPLIQSAYPHVRPLTWESDAPFADIVYEAVRREAGRRPDWALVRDDPKAGTLEAVATSPLFRFRDYVILRVTFAEGRVVVDMRSKSRDGRSDLGVNALRIASFLEAIASRVSMAPSQ